MSIPSPFWAPDRHADRRPRLLARARTVTALRGWFGGQDFIEVEPAALQVSPGNETHLHGFATELIAHDGRRHPAYLHTSPEFSMKKLLAAGETRLFTLARVFRNRERTALHAPEFTMLEWYRAGEGLGALERDCVAVLKLAAEAAGAKRLTFRGREADPFAEPERLSVREAFLRYAGVDLFDAPQASAEGPPSVATPHPNPLPQGERGSAAAVRENERAADEDRVYDASPTVPSPLAGEGKGEGSAPLGRISAERPPSAATPLPQGERGSAAPVLCSTAALTAAVANLGLRVAPDDSWSDLFSRLLSEKVEPNLGIGRPTILCDYPASEAALARLNPRDPRIAERFELYACGVELANAFGELTDPAEQRRRFQEDMALKAQLYGESYPIDEDFLSCLPYMKPTSGAALGLDRVVMLACGADNIEDVQWTPVFRP